MEFRDVLARRRVVRSYRPDPVNPESLNRVVDAFRRGPSAGFSQGQHVIVVTDDGQRRGLATACREPEYVARGRDRWLSVAPVHLVPCIREADYRARYGEPDKRASGGPDEWKVPFWWMDGGAAVMLLMLAAVDEGLATGFLDIGDRPAVRRLLGLPGDIEPLGLMTLGHPLPERPPTSHVRGRRPWNEVVHLDRWG